MYLHTFNCVEEYRVVTRSSDLVLVLEAHAAVFEHRMDVARPGSEDGLAAFAHPDGRLMGALKAMNGRVGVVVGRHGDEVLACLRCPTRHSERRRRRRNHSSRAIWRAPAITDVPRACSAVYT